MLSPKYLQQLTSHIRKEVKESKPEGSVSLWTMKMTPAGANLSIYPYLDLLILSYISITDQIDQDMAVLEISAKAKMDTFVQESYKSLSKNLNTLNELKPMFEENLNLYLKLFKQFYIDIDGCGGCCAPLAFCWLASLTARAKVLEHYESMIKWIITGMKTTIIYASILHVAEGIAPTSEIIAKAFTDGLLKKMSSDKPSKLER